MRVSKPVPKEHWPSVLYVTNLALLQFWFPVCVRYSWTNRWRSVFVEFFQSKCFWLTIVEVAGHVHAGFLDVPCQNRGGNGPWFVNAQARIQTSPTRGTAITLFDPSATGGNGHRWKLRGFTSLYPSWKPHILEHVLPMIPSFKWYRPRKAQVKFLRTLQSCRLRAGKALAEMEVREPHVRISGR